LHFSIIILSNWLLEGQEDQKNKLFTFYAILGDDLVLADKKVMEEYLRLLDEMGVKCGLHKSILSPKGIGLEFAKNTFSHGVNVSPVSWLRTKHRVERFICLVCLC
jgi:hypothetical protein